MCGYTLCACVCLSIDKTLKAALPAILHVMGVTSMGIFKINFIIRADKNRIAA